MKLLKQLAIALLFCLPAFAEADIKITNWQENSTITKTGKVSAIAIKAQAVGLAEREYFTSYSIGFDPKRKIRLEAVICDGQPAKYSFVNNVIKFELPSHKTNNNTISIAFSFEETYENINEYLRQELIDIPPFAAGANAKVTINFPQYLESATLNPHIVNNFDNFTYSNIVPQGGVAEIVKLTAKEAAWNVNIKLQLTSNAPLGDIKVKVPVYFVNSSQDVKNYWIKPNIEPTQQNSDASGKNFTFKTNEKKLLIENKAIIYIGQNHRFPVLREEKNYLKISESERKLLMPILNQISQDQRYQGLPLYAKIGKFVHEFIKYDISYVDRLPPIAEILRNPIGVCTEYAALYTALARTANIPALTIDGAACGEYNKCQGHAWNLIYQDHRWIEVDPTWDLMSGIVSSSHVYFFENDNSKNNLQVSYLGEKKAMESKIDYEISRIDKK